MNSITKVYLIVWSLLAFSTEAFNVYFNNSFGLGAIIFILSLIYLDQVRGWE